LRGLFAKRGGFKSVKAHGSSRYLESTRHPWACVVFVVPLLLAYEGGLMAAGREPMQEYRNGAETWMRMALAGVGFSAPFAAPTLLLAILLGWTLMRRKDRPRDYVGVWTGMLVESVLFALGLYVLSQAFLPLLDGLGIVLQTSEEARPSSLDPAVEKVIGYLGAGIYEETLFRLGLFSVLCWLFLLGDFSILMALNLAAVASALLFAGAHHVGPAAEPFQAAVFAFRALAGLYFAWLYQIRGFGIAVGAHTGYDVLVGILMPTL
jgi:membrane protease YdiL (CAAX protease family)